MDKYFTTRLSRKKYIMYGLLSNPLTVIFLLVILTGLLTEILFGGGDMYGVTIIDNLMGFFNSIGGLSIIIQLLSYFILILLSILPFVIFISCSIRRINDIGISRWFILFLFFYPFYINVLFFSFLLFKSGESKTNKWGEPV